MSSSEKTLSGKKATAAAHLAAGAPERVAAERANVSVRTLQRYKTCPRFAAEVAALRRRLVDSATADASGRLSSMLAPALDVHQNLLASKTEKIQLLAVKLTYDAQRQAVEQHVVLRRLDALEAEVRKRR